MSAGRLNACEAGVTRVRSWGFTLGGRLSLMPSVKVGLRCDGGDAETGAGMDVGGRLAFSDRVTGLSRDDGTHLFTRVSPFGVSVAPRTCRRPSAGSLSRRPVGSMQIFGTKGLRCFASAGVVSAVAAVWSDVLSADHFGWIAGGVRSQTRPSA